METIIRSSFTKLRHYCEKENFKGWDPYDGLNSRLFNSLPLLKRSAICRLIMIQLFKRSPVNLRRLFMVPKGHNAKGVALFLSGYCNLYNAIDVTNDLEISKEECLDKINYLSELLISLGSEGYSGACWGYNFDWESRAFFLPKGTPTVVASSFAVDALINAYEITKNKKYIDIAVSNANFILNDLNRIKKPGDRYMFSYSPLDDRAVYNATLLGTKTLSLIYKYSKNEEHINAARISAEAVCALQDKSGFFPHSDQNFNLWRDNFHTGFKLESLAIYKDISSDMQFNNNIKDGFKYWVENFFDKKTGIAKYYDTKESDIDLHCAAQAIVTLSKTKTICENKVLAEKILIWAIENMQNRKGYFYFQRSKLGLMNKIQYMRWPNAWMFYGTSFYLLINKDKS